MVAVSSDINETFFVNEPLVSEAGVGAVPPSAVGEGAVGGAGIVGPTPIVGRAPTVGMVVSTAAIEGFGDEVGAGERVGTPLGAGDSEGAGEAVGADVSILVGTPEGAGEVVGEALSAAVGAPLGAGLAVGDIVMEQSAAGMDEVISGMVKVSSVQSPSAQVNPNEHALFIPTDSSGSQMPIGCGSSSHMRNSWIP